MYKGVHEDSEHRATQQSGRAVGIKRFPTVARNSTCPPPEPAIAIERPQSGRAGRQRRQSEQTEQQESLAEARHPGACLALGTVGDSHIKSDGGPGRQKGEHAAGGDRGKLKQRHHDPLNELVDTRSCC